jgi:hypothetical protein
MPPNRHIPYRKEGLVPAIITLVATAAVFLSAFAIHRATYREPTDVMMRQRGDQPAAHAEGAAAGGGHSGAAAGGGHGAAPAPGAPAQGTPGTTH